MELKEIMKNLKDEYQQVNCIEYNSREYKSIKDFTSYIVNRKLSLEQNETLKKIKISDELIKLRQEIKELTNIKNTLIEQIKSEQSKLIKKAEKVKKEKVIKEPKIKPPKPEIKKPEIKPLVKIEENYEMQTISF